MPPDDVASVIVMTMYTLTMIMSSEDLKFFWPDELQQVLELGFRLGTTVLSSSYVRKKGRGDDVER